MRGKADEMGEESQRKWRGGRGERAGRVHNTFLAFIFATD